MFSTVTVAPYTPKGVTVLTVVTVGMPRFWSLLALLALLVGFGYRGGHYSPRRGIQMSNVLLAFNGGAGASGWNCMGLACGHAAR
jgi:hypothetical protein